LLSLYSVNNLLKWRTEH